MCVCIRHKGPDINQTHNSLSALSLSVSSSTAELNKKELAANSLPTNILLLFVLPVPFVQSCNSQVEAVGDYKLSV